MGCNSSAPASEPGSAASMGKQRGVIEGADIHFEYFGNLGRGDPITQMMQ